MRTTKLRVVLDTSVLISAALSPQGKPRRVLDDVLKHGILLISKPVFHELTTRLFRKKFNRYFRVGDRGRFCRNLYNVSELVLITETITACRDPEDDMLLELAVSGHADVVVSSDADLLDLVRFRNIPILLPAAFLEAEYWA